MAKVARKLKAPFPYFGGKSKVASLVWERLGPVQNYIEPFCGSAAMLLLRPDDPRVETINDKDCYVANFWRSTLKDPQAVAEFADWPVNEADLHARHRWLVNSDPAIDFRRQMREDPEFYDPKIAGWWCWGLCCWIGSGWCSEPDWEQRPMLSDPNGKGVTREAGENWNQMPAIGNWNSQNKVNPSQQMPDLSGDCGASGRGVHSLAGPKRTMLSARSHRDVGKGVNGKIPERLPELAQRGGGNRGVDQKRPRAHRDGNGYLPGVNGRPQLADQFSRGRGVHGNDQAELCAQRREWLLEWFGRLQDRLRAVRVCCGKWIRVCDSPSVTSRIGITGLFLDPPYSAEAGRNARLYASEDLQVAHEVREYCLERGSDPMLRIALCGYAGEGHELLEEHGWEVLAWKAQGGYGNRSGKGKANAEKERIWFSPHCVKPRQERGLFDLEG